MGLLTGCELHARAFHWSSLLAAFFCAFLVVVAQPAFADCDLHGPTTGQTATCSNAAPNPDTAGVHAIGGSTNVTVNIAAGARISVLRIVTTTGASVAGSSQITNSGTIALSGGGGTGGNRGAGLVGLGDNNTITNSGAIGTMGAFNDGMAANGSGNTLINNGTITTAGPNAYGMTAAWGQTNIGQTNNTLINNGSITTNGSNARAASILGQNGVVINTGSLTTNGDSSSTVYMQGNNARLTNSGVIHATGANAEGVFSNTLPSFTARIENLAGGQIISDQGPALRTLNGATTIVNAGLIRSGTGVALNGGTSANSAITFILQTGSQITGSANGGNGANQVRLQGSGLIDNPFTRFQTLTMEGTDWTWNGTGDFANTFVNSGTLRLQSALTGHATVDPIGTLEARAQTLNPTVTNNGLVRFAQPDIGTYSGTISGTGVVEKTESGTTILNGINTYNGGTNITAGALAVGDSAHPGAALPGGGPVNIAGSGVLGGYGSVTGPVTNNGTIAAANALSLFAGGPNGNFTINGDLRNNGSVDLAGSGVGNSLTVAGNYVGGGGLLNLNTVLGGDGSPSDRLVISGGSATGSTGIRVTNVGGGGAATTGNGIQVVQAINGATTAPGAFNLARPAEAGAYSYFLFRGSTDASGPQDWFLRSTLDCTVLPNTPGCAKGLPNLRPAVPLYTAMPALATQYGLSLLGTLHERLGIRSAAVEPAHIAQGDGGDGVDIASEEAASGLPGFWGRLLGEVGSRTNNSFLTAGPAYDWNFTGFQAGLDLFRRDEAEGVRDRAGVYGAFGHISADVQQIYRDLGSSAGSVMMDAYSIGAYLTHFGSNGWYLDAVAQGTWYAADAQSVSGPSLRTNGFGLAGSLEGGYPVALSASVVLEPQVQLVYQLVQLGNGSDGSSLVSFADANSLVGRAGGRLVKTWDTGESDRPRPFSAWLSGNMLHEFLGNPTTTFAGLSGGNALTFAGPSAGTWASVGAGASGTIGPSTTVFATAAYQRNVDGQQQYAWSGRIGITQRW